MVADVNEGYFVTVFEGENNAATIVNRKGVKFPHWPFESMCFQNGVERIFSENLLLLRSFLLDVSRKGFKIPLEL